MISREILDEYRIVKLLGRGGMGAVYLAEQIGVGGRRVAIKVLHGDIVASREVVERFKREAAAAGRINHSHVVTVYECRTTRDGQTFIAMEYVEGATLGERLQRGTPLEFSEVVEITNQIAEALSAAHELGIVHRDIKPQNIMLRSGVNLPVVKVVDFGIARLAEFSGAGTQQGVVIGTAKYMSPEQAAGKTGDEIDRRSDVYSLGLVVYEMLCGQTAFQAPSDSQIIWMQIQSAAPSLRAFNKQISEDVECVVMKALSKDRDARYASAREFARDLQTALEKNSVRVHRVHEITETTRRQIFADANGSSKPHSATAAANGTQTKKAEINNKIVNKERKTIKSRLTQITGLVAITIFGLFIEGRYNTLTEWFCASSLGASICSPTPTPEPTPSPALPTENLTVKYRIELKNAQGTFETLPEDNSFTPNAEVRFQFQATQQGYLYLFNRDDIGVMRWINPITTESGNQPQTVQPEMWSKSPQDDYIRFSGDRKERFWILFVPPSVAWSLIDFAYPSSLQSDVTGFPVIPPPVAQRIIKRDFGDDKQIAPLMSSSIIEGKVVTNFLTAKAIPDSISISEITLTLAKR